MCTDVSGRKTNLVVREGIQNVTIPESAVGVVVNSDEMVFYPDGTSAH